MNFLERDLEEIIYKTDNMKLFDRGLEIFGKKYRQLRIGNYGVLDLLTFHNGDVDVDMKTGKYIRYSRPVITIYEFKKDKVNVSAFLQAIGYMKGIQRYMEKRGIDTNKYDFRISLIGSSIDTSSSFSYITDFIDFLDVYTYEYDFDGIVFRLQGSYNLINEGF